MKQATFQIGNQSTPKKDVNVKQYENKPDPQPSKQLTSVKPSKVVENVYYFNR